jgi:hypothetical protein
MRHLLTLLARRVAPGSLRAVAHAQIASAPRSPVRMRIACSTSKTKILPSPMRPVRAAFSIASIYFTSTSHESTVP